MASESLSAIFCGLLLPLLKIKYNDGSNKNEPTNSVNHLDDVYGDLHKLDERIQEIQKLVDNSK